MKLEIVQGENRREFVIPKDVTVLGVGRDKNNDLPIDEPAASRKHLTFELTSEGWKVVDNLSQNGTLLNGEKVNFAFLKDGDQVRVGHTLFKISGIAPAKRAQSGRQVAISPSGRAAPISHPVSGRHHAAHQEAPKSSANAVLLAAGIAILAVGGLGIWFFTSGNGGGYVSTGSAPTAGNRRTAELSEVDRKLIDQANAIDDGAGLTQAKLKSLDELADSLTDKRASVVISRIDEIRTQLQTRLESELADFAGGEIKNAAKSEEDGNNTAAVTRLNDLVEYLNREGYIRQAAQNAKLTAKAEDALHGTLDRNTKYLNDTWNEVDRDVAAKKFDEAIALGQELLKRGYFPVGERAMHEQKLDQVRGAKLAGDKPDVAPVGPDPHTPDILGKIKGPKPGKLPGANPLLPKGSDSEADLFEGLKKTVIAAINGKKLTSDKVTYKGDTASILSADAKGLKVGAVREEKDENGKVEQIVYTKQVTWEKLEPADVLSLYDATPKVTDNDFLAVVIFLFNNGMTDEASKRALALYKRNNSLKDGLDNLIATKRRIAIPDGGFVEYDGRFVTPQEKDDGDFGAKLRATLGRFEKGLGSKDKKVREDSDSAFAEMLQMGERAIAPGVKIMSDIREKELAKLQKASGMAAADGGKLTALYSELEKRRKFALELIMDTVKYPYPYLPEPDQKKVQEEVDSRVKAVREIWADPASYSGAPSPDVDACIERIQVLVKRMGQLDADNKYHTVTPEEDLAYLKECVNKALSIQNFAPKDDQKAKELIVYNAEVLRYNEAFATGEGHCDADCRAEVLITNKYRIMFGVHAVKLNDKLFWSSKHHSQYQVENHGGVIAHEIDGEPKGKTPWDRMKTEGYQGSGSENIYSGDTTGHFEASAESAHEGWLHSSGHHRNILMDSWRVLGVGKHRFIWTQNFGVKDEGDENAKSKGGT